MSGTAKTGEEPSFSTEQKTPFESTTPTREDTDIIGLRVGAEVVDSVLMFVLYSAVMTIFLGGGAILGGGGGSAGASNGILAAGSLLLGVLVGSISLFAYNVGLEGWWNGQTIGKRVFNIHVVQEDGSAITPGKAAIRAVPLLTIGFVNLIPFVGIFLSFFVFAIFLVAGVVAIAMSDKRQRVFDNLAGTVVVSE
jgi:uncharacterized RDD family membrane protein YckC